MGGGCGQCIVVVSLPQEKKYCKQNNVDSVEADAPCVKIIKILYDANIKNTYYSVECMVMCMMICQH